jgi:glycosyltransferase involved in cell wall biosynthesis
MSGPRRVLINGLSIGEGGGLTVGRELLRHLAQARPAWRFTMAVVADHPVHERLRGETLPGNSELLWAPAGTGGRLARRRYERTELRGLASGNTFDAVLQLNGMVIPGLGHKTLSHFQDPWPYVPRAWSTWRDRLFSPLKRRANARALREARCAGFTSMYLRDLICGHHRIRPECAEVFHNGLRQEWIDAAGRDLPPWATRPMEILTLSNVGPHKRQSLVIQALPRILARRPDLRPLLTYRIAGTFHPPYREELDRLAASLGVGRNVVFEGRVSDARVRELYASARCFVLMSVCESFGIPALEAMCFGAPVVISDCCALPEVSGDAARICPADDVDELSTGIEAVLTDPVLAEALRQRGAQRVREFGWAGVAQRMAAVLDRLAGEAVSG